MESPQSITQEDLIRMMQAKMSRCECQSESSPSPRPCASLASLRSFSLSFESHTKSLPRYVGGVDPSFYKEEIANIQQLFEPASSYVIGQDIFIVFRGIRHTFRSLREVANAFNIPLSAPAPHPMAGNAMQPVSLPPSFLPPPPAPPPPVPLPLNAAPAIVTRPRPAELSSYAPPQSRPYETGSYTEKGHAAMQGAMQQPVRVNAKGNGRVGSQFQDVNLVAALQDHLGIEVTCGDLRAKLVSCDLGGLMFELLDTNGRGTGKFYPTSRLAKQSNLSHQNNSWKSIKVPMGGTYHTLDYWVTMIRSKLYQDDKEGMKEGGGFDQPLPKRKRNDSRNVTESEEEDFDEDNWSDDDHKSRLRKRKDFSVGADLSLLVSDQHLQVTKLMDENRALRQKISNLENVIQKAQGSMAVLMSQLQIPPS